MIRVDRNISMTKEDAIRFHKSFFSLMSKNRATKEREDYIRMTERAREVGKAISANNGGKNPILGY